jgi:hypothetical protein
MCEIGIEESASLLAFSNFFNRVELYAMEFDQQKIKAFFHFLGKAINLMCHLLFLYYSQ